MAFQSFAILSLLVSAVLAQSSSNPFIPTGITSTCSSYLTSLNSNSALTACTDPFITALQQFSPTANTTSPSSTTINSALSSLCADNAFASCSQSTVTTQLSSFYAACSAELTSNPNQQVKLTYDVLYSLLPVKQALCCKDDNGKYCATELSNSSSTGTVALVDSVNPQYLYTSLQNNGAVARRDLSNTTTALVPNATTYQDTNLLFFFLRPSMSSSQLCTTCTRNILTAYITFESTCPYAPGLSNSPLLFGQLALYNAVTADCGTSFLNGVVQAAGGLSSGLLSSAALRTAGQELSTAVGAILGIAGFMAASL